MSSPSVASSTQPHGGLSPFSGQIRCDARFAQTAETASLAPSQGCLAFGPLPCLFLVSRRSYRLPCELLIGEPLARNRTCYLLKSLPIVSLPGVVTEGLFIKVAEQMEGFHVHVGSPNCPLQEAPEVLNPVGVDMAPDVCLSMVNDLVGINVVKVFVGLQGVGEDFAPLGDLLADDRGESLAAAVRDYHCMDAALLAFPVAFQEANDGGLVLAARAGNLLCPLVLVHEPSRAADEGFVHFHLAGERADGIVSHCQADALEHEPSGLLSNIKGASNFIGANAVLGIGDKPDGGKPFVQPNRTVLKDSPNLDRELALGMFSLASPDAALAIVVEFSASASRTSHAVGPAELHHEVVAAVNVGKVLDGFEKALWGAHWKLLSAFLTTRVYQIWLYVSSILLPK